MWVVMKDEGSSGSERPGLGKRAVDHDREIDRLRRGDIGFDHDREIHRRRRGFDHDREKLKRVHQDLKNTYVPVLPG